jgi:cytochrome P450
MTWLFAALATHSEVKKKLFVEIDSDQAVKRGESTETRSRTYFDKCVDETLRWATPISVTAPRQFPLARQFSDYFWPAGTSVSLFIPAMHYNPNYWDNPDRFNPSNFDDELVRKRDPFAFVPFGAGRRMCIGRALAYEKLRTIVPMILRELDFELAPSMGKVESISKGPANQVKGGLRLVFNDRKQS